MRVKTVRDIDFDGKKVLVREDFNVPLDEDGRIGDDTRIRAALPTLQYLLERGASLILMSHLGRPKGAVVESLRLTPVAARLQELLGKEVLKLDEVVGPHVEQVCADLEPGGVVMLENLRFEPEERANDAGFSQALAALADVYVDDAFGTAHRAHASVVGVAERLPAVAGFLMEKELRILQGLLEEPARPFVAVLGGSKISDKLKVLGSFQELVDTVLIGGGMCFTVLKSQGMNIGKSLCEDELLGQVAEVMARRGEKRAEIRLPVDLVVASEFDENAASKVVDVSDIPAGWMGLDIGPRTIAEYVEVIDGAKTIFWNGPMGVFEWERFSVGTRAVAEAIADSPAVKVAGGGDTIAAIEKYGLEDRFTHISTGGGASMALLEGEILPGLAVLQDIDLEEG